MNRNKFILATALLLGSFAASAMSFTTSKYSGGSTYIQASGSIVSGDSKRFDAFLAKLNLPAGTDVFLNSGGGNVAEAGRMAYTIWSNKFDTKVTPGQDNATCASACTDMFLGGVQRIAWKDSWLGYHSGSIGDDSDITVAEAYTMGQNNGVSDTWFVVLYVDTDKVYNAVKFYSEVYGREDSSVMLWPQMSTLSEAGIVTLIVDEE